MAKKEKKDVVKAMFTCPVCGSHDMEEVSRINEVVAVMHSATIDEYGDVDVEFGEANMADAEIIDCYWRCSDCQPLSRNCASSQTGTSTTSEPGECPAELGHAVELPVNK